MVARSPSRFKQIRILLAIALALLAPITVIYIDYVSDQRTFFTSRGFRQLSHRASDFIQNRYPEAHSFKHRYQRRQLR